MMIHQFYGHADNANSGKKKNSISNSTNFFIKFVNIFFCFRTQTEAECIFHEMLHKWNVGNDNKIPCPICDRTFSKISLRCHLRLHTNERIFECDHCELKFTRKANLKEHIQRIHIKKASTNKKVPTSRSQSKRSSSTPRNDRLFTCSICEKSFRKK